MTKRIVAATIAATLAIVPGSAASAADVTLKVSTCLIKAHDQVVAYFKTFHEPINAMNAGIKLQYIGGPEVTPRQKQAAALKRGLVDIINCPSSYYSNLVPAANMTGAANVSPTELRKNGGWEIMQEAWKKGINARILAWPQWDASTFFIYLAKEPKQSEKTGLDLSGLKMRSVSVYRPFLKAMGATPVTISGGDVYAALERGVVDGLAWPEGSVAKYGWQKFIKYKIGPSFYHSTTMTVMNADSFEKLSKKHQEIILKQALIHEKDSNPILAKLSVEDNQKLKAAGVKNVDLKGKVKDAYLKTIYGARWADNDTRTYNIDYKKLRALMYKE